MSKAIILLLLSISFPQLLSWYVVIGYIKIIIIIINSYKNDMREREGEGVQLTPSVTP